MLSASDTRSRSRRTTRTGAVNLNRKTKVMTKPKLTDKQAAFVREYRKDWNATQAAIRAGYSEKGAHVRGVELLSNRKVAEAIEKAQEKLAKKVEITVENVLRGFSLIGLVEVRDFYKVDENGQPVLKSFAELTPDQQEVFLRGGLSTKDADRNKALENIAKHLGMYIKRHEHSGPDGGPIETNGGIANAERDERIAALLQTLRDRVAEDTSDEEQQDVDPAAGAAG